MALPGAYDVSIPIFASRWSAALIWGRRRYAMIKAGLLTSSGGAADTHVENPDRAPECGTPGAEALAFCVESASRYAGRRLPAAAQGSKGGTVCLGGDSRQGGALADGADLRRCSPSSRRARCWRRSVVCDAGVGGQAANAGRGGARAYAACDRRRTTWATSTRRSCSLSRTLNKLGRRSRVAVQDRGGSPAGRGPRTRRSTRTRRTCERDPAPVIGSRPRNGGTKLERAQAAAPVPAGEKTRAEYAVQRAVGGL